MCGSVVSLQYGSRLTYINGLGDVVDTPMLTLPMAFERDMEWTDWQGRSYTLKQEWAYGNGTAQDTPGCTAGRRDADRNGWTQDHFVAKAEDFVRSRRQAARREGREPKLSEDHAFLTPEEVLSVTFTAARRTSRSTNFCAASACCRVSPAARWHATRARLSRPPSGCS